MSRYMSENYYRPETIKEVNTLKESIPQAVFLSGGTQVNRAPLERVPPDTLIDLQLVLSSNIQVQNNQVTIGAFASLQSLADAENIPEALRDAASFIPTRSVRNQATIGGNIAAGRSDSYLIPALIALDAQLKLVSGMMSVEDYVMNKGRELILEIHLSSSVEACVAVKESRSHLALPVVSAAVSLKRGRGEHPDGACIAVGCCGPRVIRLDTIEKALVAGELDKRSDLEAALSTAVNPKSSILGSAEYKKYINGIRIADAVMKCREILR